jgi:hypothetical protein
MRLRACLAAAALLLLAPATASAGWWDYFDRLSGPGPFKSNEFFWPEIRLVSLATNPGVTVNSIESALARDDAEALRWFVTLRIVGMSTEHDPNQVRVELTTIDAAVMRRLGFFRGNLDVGAGLSLLNFSGAGFPSFYRPGLLLPKLTLTPGGFIPGGNDRARAALRSVKLYFDVTWTGQFSAADFQNAVPSFPGDEKVLKRAGVKIDFLTLAYALRPR